MNIRSGTLKQLKFLQEIITSSAVRGDFFSMQLEQKIPLSTSVSVSEDVNRANISCLRAQQLNSAHRRFFLG